MKVPSAEKTTAKSKRRARLALCTSVIGLISGLLNLAQSLNKPPSLSVIIIEISLHQQDEEDSTTYASIDSLMDSVAQSVYQVAIGMPDSIPIDSVILIETIDEMSVISESNILQQIEKEIEQQKIKRIIYGLESLNDDEKISSFDSLMAFIRIRNRYDLIDTMIHHAGMNLHFKRRKYKSKLNSDVLWVINALNNKKSTTDQIDDFKKELIRTDSLSDIAFAAKMLDDRITILSN